MKNKIIFIIYNRFKINNFKIYSIIIQYLYLLIFIILAMHINLIINSPQVILKNSQLAFNVNIIYISKSINKYKVIKKIELEKFNKIFLKKFLLKNTSLFKISNVNTTNILKNIERLKSYGFLTKVKLSFVKAHNIKYVTLNFKINPILKRIKISKQKTLLIPHYLLIDTFKKQIGLPKNYIDINKSINTINLWYKSRGFDWVNIELIKTKRLEEIHLKIFEGQIAKSNLVCTQENFKPSFLYHIEYNIFLFNYLSLYIFCNFAHDLYNKIRFLNFAKYHILNSSSYYEIIIGSGIQFNIPVKQIPKLRIEYSISNKTNNFLQLRAYSQYND
uniref:hypothetical protein n=1 Tax=Anunuuluaehu liula TaxID=3049639 RepID=UPI003001C912